MLPKTRALAMLTGCAMLCAAVPSECLSFAQSAVSAAEETTGQCGENAVRRFSDGVLTISGTGEIEDNPVFPHDMTKVVIENGITALGSFAFRGCSSLTAVTLPDSLTEIGWGCFEYCNHRLQTRKPRTRNFSGCCNTQRQWRMAVLRF